MKAITKQGRIIQANLAARHEYSTWRQIAEVLNAGFGVHMSAASYERWATKGIEPANKGIRAAFGLPPQPCPHCHRAVRSTAPKQPRVVPDYERWWRSMDARQKESIWREQTS